MHPPRGAHLVGCAPREDEPRRFQAGSVVRVVVLREVAPAVSPCDAGRGRSFVERSLVAGDLLAHCNALAQRLVGDPSRIVRLEIAERARRWIGEALSQTVVLCDGYMVEVAVHLRRVVDQILRQRGPDDMLAFVDFGERLRQRVLRLQQPVLDDQVVAVGVDDVADLVALDRTYVVTLHGPLLFLVGEYLRSYPRSSESKRVGRVAR